MSITIRGGSASFTTVNCRALMTLTAQLTCPSKSQIWRDRRITNPGPSTSVASMVSSPASLCACAMIRDDKGHSQDGAAIQVYGKARATADNRGDITDLAWRQTIFEFKNNSVPTAQLRVCTDPDVGQNRSAGWRRRNRCHGHWIRAAGWVSPRRIRWLRRVRRSCLGCLSRCRGRD